MKKKLIVTLVAAFALTPVAFAGHGDYRPAPDLSELAYRLENAVDDVEEMAEDRLHRRGRGHGARAGVTWGTVQSLRILERRAERFANAVDRFRWSDRRIDRDFVRLADAFERAAYEVDGVRSPRIRREFDQVARLMNRLDRRLDIRNAKLERRRAVPLDRSRGSVVFGREGRRASYRVAVDW